jgi:hypothetical protein
MSADFLFLLLLAAPLELLFLAQLPPAAIPVALALQALIAAVAYALLKS